MLERGGAALRARGPHFGSPDKWPARRLEAIAAAGEAAVPFTSGILIGIGETRTERLQALLLLRDLHERYGHLQEIIIQDPGEAGDQDGRPSRARSARPRLDDRGGAHSVQPDMNIQAPPNLMPSALQQLIAAGINDWGGISPVTPDHVNPERPWPQLDALERETARAGRCWSGLAIYPAYARNSARWVDRNLQSVVLRASDAEGFARVDPWMPGTPSEQLARPPTPPVRCTDRPPARPGDGRPHARRGRSRNTLCKPGRRVPRPVRGGRRAARRGLRRTP